MGFCGVGPEGHGLAEGFDGVPEGTLGAFLVKKDALGHGEVVLGVSEIGFFGQCLGEQGTGRPEVFLRLGAQALLVEGLGFAGSGLDVCQSLDDGSRIGREQPKTFVF